jgi:hypothetical protein
LCAKNKDCFILSLQFLNLRSIFKIEFPSVVVVILPPPASSRGIGVVDYVLCPVFCFNVNLGHGI